MNRLSPQDTKKKKGDPYLKRQLKGELKRISYYSLVGIPQSSLAQMPNK